MPITTMPLGVTAVMLPELDLPEQLDLCRRLGVTHYSVRPRRIPDDQRGKPWGNWGNHKFDLTPERLVREGKTLRKQFDDAGITPFGTVPAVSLSDGDDALDLACEGAAAVGAGRVRIAPHGWSGYPKDRPFSYAEALDGAVAGYKRAVELAKPRGLKVVIETHAGMIAASPALALNICRNFAPEELGTIFDIANFNLEGNYHPGLAVAVLGPYIDHCHVGGVRRTPGAYDAQGFRQPGLNMCPVTEADLHIPAWIKALHDAGRHVPLMVEDFTENVSGAARLTASATALRRVLDSL